MAAVASALVGPIGGTILIAAAIFSIFGTLSGSPLLYPRMLFAGGRDGLLPRFLAKIHPRYATPYWSVIAYALLSCIVSSSSGFRQLAIISSSSMLIIYVGVVLSVIKFRFTSTRESYKGFRVPGHITIPLIALVTIIWFLSHLKKEEVIGISVFAGILVVVYLLRYFLKRRRKIQRGR
ncbi:MAG: putative amino acid permease YhdG [Bacteroidetes bacterium ADurb.Bin408]|nr:MAG: putative amino acid permease YhdG [Bacteroidetes bacterium ADurb.Bin408]